jgi:hypothetical protein
MAIPELEYFMRDPKDGQVKAFSTDYLHDVLSTSNKPILVAMLGRDVFCGEVDPAHAINCAEDFYPKVKPDDQHIIVVRGKAPQTGVNLTNYMHHARDNPENMGGMPLDEERHEPTTFGMQLLKDLVLPQIPSYAAYVNEDEYEKLLMQARLKVSQFNFLNHSFGTMIMAQAEHYLPKIIKEYGYHPQDVESIVNSLSKINIANQYKVTPETSTIPGIDYNSAKDEICNEYGNLSQNDKSDILSMERIGKSLQFCPMIGDTKVDIAKITPTADSTDHERKTMTSKWPAVKERGDKPSPWKLDLQDVSDTRRHALQLYLFNDRLQLDLKNSRARYTSQAFPGAAEINEFMEKMHETSAKSAQSGIPRDTESSIAALESSLKSDAARQALKDSWEANKQRFESHFAR